MNILFISCGLSVTVGGTERVTRVLMQHFDNLGHHGYITYCMGDDTSFTKSRKLLVDYRSSYCDFEKQIDAFFEHAHVDLIVNENICEYNVSRWLRKKKEERPCLPIIYCLHNTPDLFTRPIEGYNLRAIKNRLYKTFTGKTVYMWKHQRMYDVCDRYVVLSPSYIKDFCHIFKVPNDGKVISIPNPISMRTEGYDEMKENVFLVVARLAEKQKNITAILRIWKKFYPQHKDYKLQIVGYGPDEQYLRDYAESLSLEGVEFTGKTNTPQKYYAKAKFFLMTSRYEGLPMTIVESMQFNCIPIVYDSFAAIGDIIKSGVNGILVQNNDEQSFLEAMKSLVDNEEKQEYIKNNLQSSLLKFSKENVGEQWEKLFNEILCQNSNFSE